MSELVLKNLKKTYDGKVNAVNDFNLTIADKEFIVLVGPSGCGKSTTLRMIAGLEGITSGELYIDNTLVNNISPKERDIAMVFQNYALFPHMNVAKNISYALRLNNLTKHEIEEKVKETARMLDIEPLLDCLPKTLSGGQCQRVAIARAIVRNPKVFLMDEPLSNLDASLRVQMRIVISKLHKKLNTTFIYVTHDQTEAMTLGNRIVVMKDGVIQQVDTPVEIYEHPNNLFVAGFIGSPQMNFLYGKTEKTDKDCMIKLNEYCFKLTKNQTMKLIEKNCINKNIILGIRPEKLKINIKEEEKQDYIMFRAVVEMIENIGAEIYVHVNLENKDIIVKTDSSLKIKPQDVLNFGFKLENIHIFDSKTEETIF